MSHDRNIVRDRTLVLRVLVPGLHTSLNDKINSKKEADVSTPSSTSGSSSMSADQLLNLDGVTCLPSSSDPTLWHFRCDGATYPARLVNLPCPVEVHRTHDHANYHKSADVGQMLIVYEDKYAMEEAENEKGYKVDGFPSYFHSGLTPPMRKVVQRRYLSRFEERDTKPQPPPKSDVSEVEKELQELITKFSTGKGKQKRGGASSAASKAKEIQEVEEEIVDYEPWMGDGGTFTVDDAIMHPECWLTKKEVKEIDDMKKEMEEERRRKEEEDAAREQRKAEEERKKQEEKAEKKKKKKEKKKKKQQEEEAGAAAIATEAKPKPTKKKGIASLKNQEVKVEEAEMDDVTRMAMGIINEGTENDDFLLDDDMFDFENDDIANLL
mmetsp:Transcript_25770/g.43990  ORF Transcript_25770/g.43990 Transcript_25770/m.43990 type:complete len:382 (+) Transcript_25770:88-1233(+)